MAFQFSEENRKKLEEVIGHYPHPRSAILPALHLVMEQRGWVDREACDVVAEILDVPKIHVYEALTFYTYFPQKPVGKYHIQVCHNISCNLLGAEDLIRHLEEKHGIREDEVTPDGLFCLHRVECLGACGGAPAMQVNDDYYENLTPEKIDELIEGWKRAAGNGKGEG
ncbi:MAG TPA: NADH-quinone oxidoreductase subunit NuoE [Bacteroidetes bacterium]|nr:NADH-quinone oxidoreductase subunit NuoE [Bacteroidota bacterium]